MMQGSGKILMLLGTVVFLAGVFLFLAGKFTSLGKLPGDILIRRGDFTFYFPFTTCILISLVISFILYYTSRR